MNIPQTLPSHPPLLRPLRLVISLLLLAGLAGYIHTYYGAEVAWWLRLFLLVLLFFFALALLLCLVSLLVGVISKVKLEREQWQQAREKTAEFQLNRLKTQAEVQAAVAKARRAEQEAEFAYITAGQDETVFVRDTNPRAVWRPLHLIPNHRINGAEATPTDLEVSTWQQWRLSQSPQLSSNNPAVAALPAVALPERIRLDDLLNGPPSLERLALGVTLDPHSGQVEVVRGAMRDLVHVAVGGSSGFGKSMFVRQLTYQLLHAIERPELALVDLEPNALSPFANADRLRYPLASDEQSALAVFAALNEEMSRRMVLFNQLGVDDLFEYNRVADEPLPPVVCVADEANDLMEIKAIENEAQLLARRGRKAGMWIVLAAQEWKVSQIDGRIRRQLSTRVQFRANDQAQARMLVGRNGARLLEDVPKGRAVIYLPGRGAIQLQTPYISKDEIAGALPLNGRRPPAPPPVEPRLTEQEQLIFTLADQGASRSAIARAVFGDDGGNQLKRVMAVLAQRPDRNPVTP